MRDDAELPPKRNGRFVVKPDDVTVRTAALFDALEKAMAEGAPENAVISLKLKVEVAVVVIPVGAVRGETKNGKSAYTVVVLPAIPMQ